MAFRIPIYKPVLGREEVQQLTECVTDNWLTGGPKVKKFEREIADRCKVQFAIACTNGTTALYLALSALGMLPGAEVIVPDFTFIASANAVLWAGGTPVFVDVDYGTWNINPFKIEGAITEKTWGIMPVHIYGQSVNMDAVVRIARKHSLKVVEDACQGIGVLWEGKPVGGIGDAAALSFYADKTITTGEGGMVLTNDEEVARRCLILKHQGRTGRGWYVHDYVGYNFRMTDMQAGVGLAQLGKLDWIIQQKGLHSQQYCAGLREVQAVTAPFLDRRGLSVPFRHNITVPEPDKLIAHLATEGIESKRAFVPLHIQPCYLRNQQCPNAAYAHEHLVSLPSSPLLADSEIEEVCEAIRRFYA